MWLVVIGIAVLVSSLIYFLFKHQRKKYKLDILVLMLLGTFIMVLVDHIISFFETGVFIEATTDGLIKNSTLLGLVMVLVVVIVWVVVLVVSFIRKK